MVAMKLLGLDFVVVFMVVFVSLSVKTTGFEDVDGAEALWRR